MAYYTVKIIITTMLIVAISEISKRNSFFAAFVASLPLMSILAILWLYIDTKDILRVSALTSGVFWLVLPSLAFFITLPLLLKNNLNFYLSMTISVGLTSASYWIMLKILNIFDIKL